MRSLLLRFDAPLMSFGGVMVDQNNVTDLFPGLSAITGLLANALGYSHGDTKKLEALQNQIEYAARWDIESGRMEDYHTVDLGQPKMVEPGWTTRGTPEWREGGSAAKKGTHIRYRHYLANGVMTLAVALKNENGPDIDALASALRKPARPLFIGRKACLPAEPIFLRIVSAKDVYEALDSEPRFHRLSAKFEEKIRATWPVGTGPDDGNNRTIPVYDRRNWLNQIHTGRRIRIEGYMEAREK